MRNAFALAALLAAFGLAACDKKPVANDTAPTMTPDAASGMKPPASAPAN